MIFLNPSLLFALFALIIPVIIHLFNFRRAKRVYFSNTSLLKDVKEVTSSKRRLKHLLVLCSRLLFITFLVLAFAQPYIPAAQEERSEYIKIYLDNSFSMTNPVSPGQSQEDVAIGALQEILSLYPEESRIRLIDNGFSSGSNLYYSRSELEDRLTEIEETPVSRTLDEVIRRMSFRSESNEKATHFILSDFQKSTLGSLEDLPLDTSQIYYFMPVQGENTSNAYLDTVYLANPFVREGEPNRIMFRIMNKGEVNLDDLLVKLYVNDKQASSTGLSIPAFSSSETGFDINFSLESVNACRISFEEFPISYDNDLFFTLNLTGQISILEIRGESIPVSVEKVYGNTSLFRFASFNPGSLDYSRIAQSDMIVLNGLQNIDDVLIPYLRDFLQGGGTLLLIPNERPDLSSYRSLIPQITGISSFEERVSLSTPDQNNPFFNNIFESSNDRFDMPEAVPFLQWVNSGTTLLKYRQGTPFLTSFSTSGTTYLLSTPLLDEYTNFTKHALFVPVMYRIAVLSKSQSDFLYHTLNEEVISLKMDSISRNDIFKLKKEDSEIIPEQRIVNQELIFEIPKNTLTPGFYDLNLEDERKGILSVNANKRESILENYSEEDLVNSFSEWSNVRIRAIDDIDSLSKSIKEEQFGISLWKYCLFLALIFLLAEILLIKFL
jgi:hypothetical protein